MTGEIEINGFCESRFDIAKEAFMNNFEQFGEIGASFAVTLNGKTVVDIWAGYTDAAKTSFWERDTIVNVFSTTKIMTSICVLMLADKNLLDLDSPVCKYWPEFGTNGKEKITVRHVLSHTAGVPSCEEAFPQEDLVDWEKMVKLMEKQKTWWEPGTNAGYHAITFGFILGEIVRRITGKTLGTYFKENIAQPLDADFYIGIPKECEERIVDLIPPEAPFIGDILDHDSIIYKILGIPGGWNLGGEITKEHIKFCNSLGFRKAEIPASNGSSNARAVARIASAISCGGEVDNINILSQNMIDEALKEQFNGPGLLFIDGIRYGTGFGLPSKWKPIQNPNTLYWGGWGGSVCIMDLNAKLSIAYVMNKMRIQTPEETRKNKYASDSRANLLVSSVYEALNQ
ncbi:MAG: beta-lactamase family protein [Candidatus Lokiarchaeota archaeon]|nr:beta-lactamase family protein [Candidatus Lokiarchaeota archaeon]